MKVRAIRGWALAAGLTVATAGAATAQSAPAVNSTDQQKATEQKPADRQPASGQQSTPQPNAARQSSPESTARIDPAARLQDAHVTLTRLTERSMSQDARMKFGTLTEQFNALSRAYTGRDSEGKMAAGSPESGRSAAAGANTAAATPTPASADWAAAYQKVEATLNELLGARAEAGQSAVGTSGSTDRAAKPSAADAQGMAGLPAPARADLERFRMQLNEFHAAAGMSRQPAGATDSKPAAPPQ